VRRQRLEEQQLHRYMQHLRHPHRAYANRGRGGPATGLPNSESNWQQRTDMFQQDMSEEFKKFPMVTAMDLRGRKERPRRVKMLMRDFIEGWPPDMG
jgi:hypothetical protein